MGASAYGTDFFSISVKILPLLLIGFTNTLSYFFWSVVFGLAIGVVLGLFSSTKIHVIKYIVLVYIYLMRGLPFLIVLFIAYHVLPYFGVTLSAPTAGIVALSIHSGAYYTEIFRGGIEAIHKSQRDAAVSLGLSYLQRMTYVIIPQALRLILPPLAGQMVLHFKDTAVLSLIAVPDVTTVGRQIMQANRQPFIVFGWVAAFYAVICYPMLKLSLWLEKLVVRYGSTA